MMIDPHDASIEPRGHSTMTRSAGPTRRMLLKGVSSGFGYLAFAGLSTMASAEGRDGKASPLSPRPPHFPAKAKRVIFLCMHGAPSHVDTFDHKPRLLADTDKPSPVARLA